MQDTSNHLFLLTRYASSLQEMRQAFEPTGFSIIGSCSIGQLFCSCYESEGCVVLRGEDFSTDEIQRLLLDMLNSGLSHAVLVCEKTPNSPRAVELVKLQICDYFQMNSSVQSLVQIFEHAFSWSRTHGQRNIVRYHLKQCWNRLDPGLQDVLRLLYQGATNDEAARQLQVSRRTIENRRAKLPNIFGVRSFAELIRVATQVIGEDPLPETLWNLPTSEQI